MAKESLSAPQKAPIFRETFADEQTTRVLGGVPTSVTYTNGVGSFNGTSSLISYGQLSYKVSYLKSWSIRMNITITDNSGSQVLVNSSVSTTDAMTASISGTNISFGVYRNSAWAQTNKTISLGTHSLVMTYDGTTPLLYIDGVIGTAGSDVLTGARSVIQLQLGAQIGNLNYYKNSMELVEIYDYTLTANEVANLYKNSRYEGIQYASGVSESFNASFLNGNFSNKYDSTLTTSGTPTIVRDGDIWCANYEYGSSKYSRYLSSGLTGDKTLILWVKPVSNFTGAMNLFTNGQFVLQADWGGGQAYYFSRTNFTGTYRFGTSIEKGKWQMLVVTTTANGSNATIYKNAVSIASGNIQTPSGTSGAINIGNSSSTSGAKISGVRVIDGILTAQEISQLFSNERRNYGV